MILGTGDSADKEFVSSVHISDMDISGITSAVCPLTVRTVTALVVLSLSASALHRNSSHFFSLAPNGNYILFPLTWTEHCAPAKIFITANSG